MILVACVGLKLDHAAPARDLYRSPWFIKARAYAEARGRWAILSALHGLVWPDQPIEPYDLTLSEVARAGRRAWAAGVHEALVARVPVDEPLVIMAGRAYRDELLPLLERSGHTVEVPMAGLGIGQQLRWLTRNGAS